MLLDTTVLIDLQRELRRGVDGAASQLVGRWTDTDVAIGFVSWMEFAEGYPDDRREACEGFLSGFRVLWPDAETAWRAARISRFLRAAGNRIGDHDLWIAALALQRNRPVATRNDRHFRKVPGLDVRVY